MHRVAGTVRSPWRGVAVAFCKVVFSSRRAALAAKKEATAAGGTFDGLSAFALMTTTASPSQAQNWKEEFFPLINLEATLRLSPHQS